MSTIRPLAKIKFNPAVLGATTHGPLVGDVQVRLRKLGRMLNLHDGISKSELSRKELGATTAAALKALQQKFGLTVTGALDSQTLSRLNQAMEHEFIAQSKSRTQRLQQLLQDAGYGIGPDELKERCLGPNTRAAINACTGASLLSEQGLKSIETAAFKKRMTSRRDCAAFHRLIKTAVATAKIANVKIDDAELKAHAYGVTTKAAVTALQTQYKLKSTSGDMDAETHALLASLRASIPDPVRLLKAGNFADLTGLRRQCRLNQVGAHVQTLQKSLAAFGLPPSQAEYEAGTYGKTTRTSVLAFQRDHRLQETGQVDRETQRALNIEVARLNPRAASMAHRRRVKGSVRGVDNGSVAYAKVEVWSLPRRPDDKPLASKSTGANGFFDIPYAAPRTPASRGAHQPLRLRVIATWKDSQGTVQSCTQDIFNPPSIAWANFSLSDKPYWRSSVLDQRVKALRGVLDEVPESWAVKDALALPEVRRVARMAKLTVDEVIQYILTVRAYSAGHELTQPDQTKVKLSLETWFAFIGQDLPLIEIADSNASDLSSSLAKLCGQQAVEACLRDFSRLPRFAEVVHAIQRGLAFMSPAEVHNALVRAERLRLCSPRSTLSQTIAPKQIPWTQRKYDLEERINLYARTWILDHEPLGPGGMRLTELLDFATYVPADETRLDVADAYRKWHQFGAGFWSEPFALAEQLREAIRYAEISEFSFPLTKALMTPTKLSLRALASMTDQEWQNLARRAGIGPDKVKSESDRLQGNLAAKYRGAAYWRAVEQQSTWPSSEQEAVWGQVGEWNFDLASRPLHMASDLPAFPEDHFPLLQTLQRVHRISPSPAVGALLWKRGVRSAQQVVTMGIDRLRRLLCDEEQHAEVVYELARTQYAKALKVLLGVRDLQASGWDVLGTPLSSDDPPDFQSLFGSADTREVQHADSVYGPPAYLADLLRYLSKHFAKGASVGYDVDKVVGHVYPTWQNGAVPVFRYAKNGSHYCTTNASEKEQLVQNGYAYEGVAFYVREHSTPGTKPLLRLKSSTAQDYVYATDAAPFPGYTNDGELGHAFEDPSAQGGTTALYQLVKRDGSVARRHFYTASAAERDSCGGQTVQDVLLQRRPDIAHVRLNKENTETPLPYIDLVCEILEHAVITGRPESSFARQTNWTAERLRAEPEHVNAEAYKKLAADASPLVGTFGLWHEQIRLQLQQLRQTRWELTEAFLDPLGVRAPKDAGDADPKLIASWSAEYWSIHPKDFAVICHSATHTLAELCAYWGLQSSSLPDAMPVQRLMDLTGLTYDQVLELRTCDQWLFRYGAGIPELSPSDAQNASEQGLKGLTFEHWDRLLRLLGLHRHTAWTLAEVDELLMLLLPANVGVNPDRRPTGRTLGQMMQLDRVQKRFGLDFNRTLLLASGLLSARQPRQARWIDRRQPSFYERLLGARDCADSPAEAQAPTEQVQTAFGLSASDLAKAWDLACRSDRTPLMPTTWGMSEVAAVGQIAQLTASVELQSADLLKLLEHCGGRLHLDSPGSILRLASDLTLLSTFKIEPHEACYWLGEADSVLEPADNVLSELRTALKGDNHFTGKSDGGVLGEIVVLSQWLGLPADVTRALKSGFEETVGDVVQLTDGALRRLHRAASLLAKLNLVGQQSLWLADLKNAPKLFDFREMAPLGSASDDSRFSRWNRLIQLLQWCDLQRRCPAPSSTTSWATVLDLAHQADISLPVVSEAIATLLRCEASEVESLAKKLPLAASDFREIPNLLTVERVLHIARKLRVGVGILHQVANPAPVVDIEAGGDECTLAGELDLALRRAFPEAEWLVKLTPMQDVLRERKRDALMAYLLRKSRSEYLAVRGAYPKWRDADDLLSHYLIDVQMSACQLTSRIKQAISSTQMFVQRCLLGHERERVEINEGTQVSGSADHAWKQWKWMKSYRLWEANRKVFLYPENWVDPALRIEKSPFFETLENELLQSDLDDAAAERALANYLASLHRVANLEHVAVYQEVEDSVAPASSSLSRAHLHVLARTRSQPLTYYYRRRELWSGHWSPWEEVSLDIQGDHPALVTYNRRLYLFWLEIAERPQKQSKTPVPPANGDSASNSDPGDTPETPSQLEIKLCWSSLRGKTWAPKQISRHTLIHPWPRPLASYQLKPRFIATGNQLWLDIFISQSPAFNAGRFWDCYESALRPLTKRTRFDRTARPWHSSSFVFDGQVTDVYMKSMGGDYHMPGEDATQPERLVTTTSFDYVRARDLERAADYRPLWQKSDFAQRRLLPEAMVYRFNNLATAPTFAATAAVNIIEGGRNRKLLGAAPAPSTLVASEQALNARGDASGRTCSFQVDGRRSYYIESKTTRIRMAGGHEMVGTEYLTQAAYHPYTSLFMRELNREGVQGLLVRNIQVNPGSYPFASGSSLRDYKPNPNLLPSAKISDDGVDFDSASGFGIYNWELFFHIPFLIASRLSQNQRYEDAMRWFHYIFNPTDVGDPKCLDEWRSRYWITKPFFEFTSKSYQEQLIPNLLALANSNTAAIAEWRNNPFQPHVIAAQRPVAYQRAVLFKYIDNLIAWGDQLFLRETMESLNEATTLYTLALQLLGRKPIRIHAEGAVRQSYAELLKHGELDDFANAQLSSSQEVQAENLVDAPATSGSVDGASEPLPVLASSYFDIPGNDSLEEYWKKIELRLFNLRHCRNLQGAVRKLPLFEPPIDPARLVRAEAAGLDPFDVLASLAEPPRNFRFQRLHQKAVEYCAEVRNLGEKVLMALEKCDGEELAVLRSKHELNLLNAVRSTKVNQTKEAKEALKALELNRALAQHRYEHFDKQEFRNGWETAALRMSLGALGADMASQTLDLVAGTAGSTPDVTVGVSGPYGTPVTVTMTGGSKAKEMPSKLASALSRLSSWLDRSASTSNTIGGFHRRMDEWRFQAQQAKKEISQIERQIEAAALRLEIAEADLANHDLQVEQTKGVDTFLRSKFTNRQLYSWQVQQLSALYLQAYRQALDLARQAESASNWETGTSPVSCISPAHWDGLRRGLLAGDKLTADLRMMELHHMKEQGRQFEITKSISLSRLDATALVTLKATGTCALTLPKALLDADYPDHMERRIKSVSMTVPCVVGPYSGVNAELTLTKAKEKESGEIAVVSKQSIVTSHASSDSGMFELSLNDDRYLPFEGYYVDGSEWQIDLKAAQNGFDVTQVSDVVMHLRYTAKRSKDPGEAPRQRQGSVLLRLRSEFASSWQAAISAPAAKVLKLDFGVGREHLPYMLRAGGVKLKALAVCVDHDARVVASKCTISAPSTGGAVVQLSDEIDGSLSNAETSGSVSRFESTMFTFGSDAVAPVIALGDWALTVELEDARPSSSLQSPAIRDVYLALVLTSG